MDAGIQALLAWTLLFSGEDGVLEESSVDYGGLLEQMEAAELLTLIEQAQARLMDPADNAFSENASSLNARLEVLFPDGTAGHYKIQGYNGYPRRIQLDPLLVTWE